MDVTSIWTAVISSGATAVVGVLTWLGVRASASSRRDEAEITTRGEEWRLITSEIKAWANERIAEQDKKLKCLEGKVGHLEQENELTKTKYWKAIFYGRAWRLRHPESVPHVDVPPEIADDL